MPECFVSIRGWLWASPESIMNRFEGLARAFYISRGLGKDCPTAIEDASTKHLLTQKTPIAV